jgi:hypothetical protein
VGLRHTVILANLSWHAEPAGAVKKFYDIPLILGENVIEPNFGAGFEGQYSIFGRWFIVIKE